ncbi:MAG: PAS domain-containing protein, partial [Butyricicoccus sp.]|nr:PAS domain-containing protein [Butyricicoccus sp.]
MTYRTIMNTLSHYGLGAVLTGEDGLILEHNSAALQLLGEAASINGRPLREVARFLADGKIGNPRFNTYLQPCPPPENLPLPLGTRLYVFRDVTSDFRTHIWEQTFNHVDDAITFWDDQGRLLALNDAAIQQESVIAENVIGQHIDDLYENNVEGASWAATRVIEQ